MLNMSVIALVNEILKDADQIDWTFPEDKRRYIQEKSIELAVRLADEVILAASGGTTEETDYLTAEVATGFVMKLLNAIRSRKDRAELEEKANQSKRPPMAV